MITLSQNVQQVQESPVREGASVYEVTKRPFQEEVRNKSNLKKVCFTQQSPNVPSGIPSCKIFLSKMPKMVDLASTDLRRFARLANKPRQKYGLFSKLSLELIGACDVDKNSHTFLARENIHIK